MNPLTLGTKSMRHREKPRLERANRTSRVGHWALMASLAAWAPPANAQTATPVSVSVDATAPGAPLERVWPYFGFDEINYTTSAEGRALLGTLAEANSAPVHVRSHFLFNTGDGTPGLKWGSTNVYTQDAAGNAVYDFRVTDGIMDAITGAGAFPFVELGFMPQALSTHPDPYRNSSSMLLDGGSVYPPTDYAKWAGLIRTWASHANTRYPGVARSWLWELWNEPDIGYWAGTFDEYAQLYDYTEASLHEVMPSAVLGGPAVAGPAAGFLRKFLEHCATGTNAVSGEVGTRLDLVSFHAKGGVQLNGDHAELSLGSQLRLHRAGFKLVASFPSFKSTPIYITEADPDGCAACPLSSSPALAYRTSPAYGAYEMAMMKRSLELEAALGVKLGGVLTWAFTFPGTPYFSGYRALATNGIELPVLGAFRLLGRLSGARLPLTSSGAHPLDDLLTNSVHDEPEVDGLAAVDGTSVRVLLWNYHDELVPSPATPVHLKLTLPASFGPNTRVSHLRVDEAHGDAYPVWQTQGSPAQPSPAQVTALQQAMAPSSVTPDRFMALTSDGSVELDFDLPRFGVSLLTFVPVDCTASSCVGSEPLPHENENESGCACRINRGGTAAALPGLVALLLAAFARRRTRREARRRYLP